jgi:autotransporter-associated beta strand protein
LGSGASGFDWALTSVSPTITTVASGTTSTISPAFRMRYGGSSYKLNLNVPQGTTASGQDLVLSGAIQSYSGEGINKLGPGTAVLSGVNTYTGATTVSNGTLRVNGSLAAASAVAIASAGTLGGTGTVSGTVSVNGTIAPGPGVGTLNTGAETWNGGGAYVCEFSSTNGSGCDRLNITGALNVQVTNGGPFTVRLASLTAGNTPGLLANFNKFANYTWTIATASGSVSNFAANKFALDASAFSNDWSGGSFALAQAGNNLVLNYSAAPLVSPVFTAIAHSGPGGLQLSGAGGAGQAYLLLGATNLSPAVWTRLATNLAGTNGVFQFSDTTTNAPQRFYRVSTP